MDIQNWLAGERDFAAGVALYEAHGGSSVYRQLFAHGATSYSRQVLEQQLRALVQVPTPQAAAAPEPAVSAPLVPSSAESAPTAADAPLVLQVRQQLREVRDQRSQAHAQLTSPGLSRKNRGTLAHRILDLGDQVLALQAAEAHVLAHGRLPGPVATAEVTDGGELRRRLDNLVSKRSKLRKQPARAAELPAVEKEIQLIRQKLNS